MVDGKQEDFVKNQNSTKIVERRKALGQQEILKFKDIQENTFTLSVAPLIDKNGAKKCKGFEKAIAVSH